MSLCVSLRSVGCGQYEKQFKNVTLSPHFACVQEASNARAKAALTHSPRNLRLQGKARVQDGPCFGMKILKKAVFSFGIRLGGTDVGSFFNLGGIRCCELIWDSCWLNKRQFGFHVVLRRGAPGGVNSFTEKFEF